LLGDRDALFDVLEARRARILVMMGESAIPLSELGPAAPPSVVALKVARRNLVALALAPLSS